MIFEWDPDKAASNRKKHSVDFADAVGVFDDDLAITIEDDQAEGERRFISIGKDFTLKILVVVDACRMGRCHTDHLGPQGHEEREADL